MESSKVIWNRNVSEPQKAESVRMSNTVTKKILASLQATASRQAKSKHLRDQKIGCKERGKQFTRRRLQSKKRIIAI